MKVCKLSVCKEPTLYQSVRENVSESLIHSLFLHKTIQLSLLIYSKQPVVRHFTNWWHLSHFPWTTAFDRSFAISILWCYNFNGMIKWYDISCAALYVRRNIETRSRNYFCRRKAMSINTLREKECECVCVCICAALVIQNAKRTRRVMSSVASPVVPYTGCAWGMCQASAECSLR